MVLLTGEAWLGLQCSTTCIWNLILSREPPLLHLTSRYCREDTVVDCTVCMPSVSWFRGPLTTKRLRKKATGNGHRRGLAVLATELIFTKCSSYSAVLWAIDSSNGGTTQQQRKPPDHANNGYSSLGNIIQSKAYFC